MGLKLDRLACTCTVQQPNAIKQQRTGHLQARLPCFQPVVHKEHICPSPEQTPSIRKKSQSLQMLSSTQHESSSKIDSIQSFYLARFQWASTHAKTRSAAALWRSRSGADPPCMQKNIPGFLCQPVRSHSQLAIQPETPASAKRAWIFGSRWSLWAALA